MVNLKKGTTPKKYQNNPPKRDLYKTPTSATESPQQPP